MKLIFIFFQILTLSACAVFNDDYTCGEVPHTGCTPVSQVYEETNGPIHDYRHNINKEDTDADYDPQIIISSLANSINYLKPGDPILTKPVVMRVLYRSFENDENDLDAGGYTYLRMRESEWVLQK